MKDCSEKDGCFCVVAYDGRDLKPRGRHVVDVLRIISAADGLLHAYKLTRLRDNRPHSRGSFSARLTLYQSRE